MKYTALKLGWEEEEEQPIPKKSGSNAAKITVKEEGPSDGEKTEVESTDGKMSKILRRVVDEYVVD